MRVLIVDDSKAMRRLERDVLSELDDVEVVEAEDGMSAIYKLREHNFQFDLILVDWVMPTMDGITFVRLVKSQPNLKDIWILMVTSCSDEAKMRQARNIGVDGYLLKPFTKELFLRAIMSLTVELTSEADEILPDDGDVKVGGVNFLNELSDDLRSRMVGMSIIQAVDANQTVLASGKVPESFYFVSDGRIDEVQAQPDGSAHRVRVYTPGECFAVVELMASDPLRTSFLTAIPSRLGRLPKVAFESMLEKFPKISLMMSRCLAAKAKQLEVELGEDDSNLSGRLEVLDLPTLIQAIQLRQKTCAIQLTEIGADVAFVCGQVVSARFNELIGEDAFFRIVADNPAHFRVVANPNPHARNIQLSTTKLLLEAVKRVDEQKCQAARTTV